MISCRKGVNSVTDFEEQVIKLLKKILNKLDEIESNTGDVYYTKSECETINTNLGEVLEKLKDIEHDITHPEEYTE